CRTKLQQGETPKNIIEQFLKEQPNTKDQTAKFDFLFRVIQFVERQVVLIDALEDATFEDLNNLNGPGSISSLLTQAKEEKKTNTLLEKINNFSIRPVLTAHPTQFYPGRVLAIITDLTDAIKRNKTGLINTYLMQLGMTPFFKKKKPTPYDEAVNLTWYLQNIFYNSAGNIISSLRKNLSLNPGHLQLIQLGFWPGGDRDGNPFVNTDITLSVARRLKETILKCYYSDIRIIRRRISFTGVYEKLLEIEQQLLESIRGKESLDCDSFKNGIQSILDDLNTHHKGVFKELLEDFLDRITLFGFYFAALDYRQDRSVIENTLKHVSLDTLLEQDITAETLFNIEKPIDILPSTDDRIGDTLETFKTIKRIQETNGEQGCHRYIISNCQGEMDIASAYFLAKQTAFPGEKIPIDFIPLFETIDDLKNAEKIVTALFENNIYRTHLTQRSNKQTIMLGFSDGTKDGGYLSANWNIYKTRESLSSLSEKYGIKVVFFDGRGGPPARGGGNTHNYYVSLGSKIASTEIQITIQGQTISSKFGTIESARLNLEQLMTAGLDNLIFDDEHKKLKDKERTVLNDMSRYSLDAYTELKNHEIFTPFLMKMSPLKYYNRTNIGSRPDKRSNSDELDLSQLRAIPFVGAWSQLKQNIPGYYGLGTALKKMEDQGKIDDVCSLYNQSGFFRALIENSMQSMCKTYFPLTHYMKDDPVYGEFWTILKREYDLTETLILKISGQKELLEKNESIKASIALREETVLPLLVIQQYASMKLRENNLIDAQKETLEKIIIRSLFGNINASRNSA
ncbi:MAG: phosphoenolpyruvate carboxylase, partial [Candidatus Marinimicrobia bacterium]|nr:phosphoenolpyruvate carboxylase [Candidatus Neomarinimicrobiota bacterium]